MGKNSKIEWTHHTFNPWWGCTRVSEACVHCYAETWAKRLGKSLWGPKSPRRFFSDAHWAEPLKWNREAKRTNTRFRVFCASMADVFEDRDELDLWREKLWSLIEQTPNLDWLLLTKRPQVVLKKVPWGGDWPSNVWLGTTVEDQEAAAERLPHLALIPAKIRFISAEPLLSALDLKPWLGSTIDWVITGGESGPKARPTSPSWFRQIMRDCKTAKVAFHFKQWGDWGPLGDTAADGAVNPKMVEDGTLMVRVGKKVAGRMLNGKTWDGLPKVRGNDRTANVLEGRRSSIKAA